MVMKPEKRIELRILGISADRMPAGTYALMLGEMDGDRRLAVLISASEAQSMLIEIKGIQTPRPQTHTLFTAVLDALDVQMLRMLIYKEENGIFYSYIYLRTADKMLRVDARTSDAVALAMRMSAPILINEEILDAEQRLMAESLGIGQTNEARLHASMREQELSTLKKALQKAIEEEDYEQATILRDRINQYKNNH